MYHMVFEKRYLFARSNFEPSVPLSGRPPYTGMLPKYTIRTSIERCINAVVPSGIDRLFNATIE